MAQAEPPTESGIGSEEDAQDSSDEQSPEDEQEQRIIELEASVEAKTQLLETRKRKIEEKDDRIEQLESERNGDASEQDRERDIILDGLGLPDPGRTDARALALCESLVARAQQNPGRKTRVPIRDSDDGTADVCSLLASNGHSDVDKWQTAKRTVKAAAQVPGVIETEMPGGSGAIALKLEEMEADDE
jgi:hypothetical protein